MIDTECKNSIGDVLKKLAKKELQVKLLVGYRDCLNGYGWNVRYYVEVIQCIEFCSTCRNFHNVDYKEDYHQLNMSHRHSHRQEYKTIFAKEFMSEDDMCLELLKFA